MGVKIVSRTYGNPHTVGTTSFPKNNVLDWNSAVIEVDVSIHNDYTQQELLSFISTNKLANASNIDFNKQGFYKTGSFTLSFDIYISGAYISTTTTTRNIEDIQGNTLEYDGADIIPLYTTNMPQERQIDNGAGVYIPFEYKNVFMYIDTIPKELLFEYGTLTNDTYTSTTLASFVDGTTRNYKVKKVDTIALAGTSAMDAEGRQSGMAIENPILRYISKVGHVYKYNFEFDVLNNSLMDTNLNSVENNVYPDIHFKDNCPTDNFKVRFLPLAGDPNVSISNNMLLTKTLGNVGWLEESFNGGENDFVVESVGYTDLLLNPITELDYASSTIVKATISGVENLVVGTSSFGLTFSTLPKNDSVFKDLDTQWSQNLYVNTCGVAKKFDLVINGGAFDPTVYNSFTKDSSFISIKDIRFQKGADPLKVEVQFTVVPNASFSANYDTLTQNNRSYGLFVSCADSSLTTAESNRATKKIDTGLMQKAVVQFGEYTGLSNSYIANYEDKTDVGNPTANVFPQDNFASKLSFTNDLADNITINNIDFRIELVHDSDGRRYLLDSFIADLTSQITDVNGVQQFDFLGSRGFLIDESTNDKNIVEVVRDDTLDSGTAYGYAVYCGLKERYEDWIEKTDLPEEVFNPAKLKNGFNNYWFYLDSLTDWSVKYVVQIEANTDGTIGVYRNEFDISHKDYDSNGDIATTSRFYRQSDGQLLTTAIIGNDITRLEVDLTLSSGMFSSLASDIYVEFQIEENDGGGWKSVYQFSNIHKTQPNSPFLPIDTFTYLKITGGGTAVITAACLINGAKMPVVKYRINAVIKTPLMVTKSVLFDGVNERVECGTSIDFESDEEFTLIAWINPQTTLDFGHIMGKYAGSDVGLDRGILFSRDNNDKLHYQIKGSTSKRLAGTGTTSVLQNTWSMVALTYKGNQINSGAKLYLNAVLETKTGEVNTLLPTPPTIKNSSELVLGDSGSLGNHNPFNGYMKYSKVYSDERSVSQLLTLYNLGCPLTNPDTTNLEAFWKMGEGDTFPTLLDSKGSNHGIMEAMEVGDITTVSPC